jgi:hypothetical protein
VGFPFRVVSTTNVESYFRGLDCLERVVSLAANLGGVVGGGAPTVPLGGILVRLEHVCVDSLDALSSDDVLPLGVLTSALLRARGRGGVSPGNRGGPLGGRLPSSIRIRSSAAFNCLE